MTFGLSTAFNYCFVLCIWAPRPQVGTPLLVDSTGGFLFQNLDPYLAVRDGHVTPLLPLACLNLK